MYILSLVIIAAITVFLEWGRMYSRFPDYKKPVAMGGGGLRGLRLFSVFRIFLNVAFLVSVFLIFFNWSFSILSLALGSEPVLDPTMRVFLLGAAFLLFLVHSHLLCFYFGGIIKKSIERVLRPKAWPKVIDYPYYLFSVALVAVLVFSYAGEQVPLSVIHLEIIVALYLLSLKILKTSIEIYPEEFASEDIQIRSITGREILGRQGWVAN